MNLAVMRATKRNREFVTDLAAERAELRKANMMRICRLPFADEARLRCNELEMLLVAKPARLWKCQDAFIDGGAR
jgi:hypothetical protein